MIKYKFNIRNYSSMKEKYKGRFKNPEGFLGPRESYEGGGLSPNKSQMAAKEVELLPTKQGRSLLCCLSQLLRALGSHSW